MLKDPTINSATAPVPTSAPSNPPSNGQSAGGILAGMPTQQKAPTATTGNASTTKKSTSTSSSPDPDLRKMLHALLDKCADGESIVLTKFKVDGTIKLRFGYNIGTQISQKTTKASGIKEACSNLLADLIKEELANGKKKP